MSIKHRGIHYSRIEHSPREKAFADHWEKECQPNPGTNWGMGLLQDLMYWISSRASKRDRLFHFFPFKHRGHFVFHIGRRDAAIAATVIQWLGSNCGWCFLEEVLKECGYRIIPIKKDRDS